MAAERNADGRTRALRKVERDYPGWQAQPAVLAGLVCARRPRTSPPLVVGAVNTDELRQAIESPRSGARVWSSNADLVTRGGAGSALVWVVGHR